MNNFEKALRNHKRLIANRKKKDKEIRLQQMEENLKGITVLVNKMWEDFEEIKKEK